MHIGRRIKHHLDLWIVDHGCLRSFYANRFCLPGPLYRANQPSPAMLAWYQKHLNIRSIVNLRGVNESRGFYRLEEEACENLGLTLHSISTLSRGLLPADRINALKLLIEQVETPALAHCKSGADRAGFFAVLWRHWRLGEPLTQALEELHWKYGHFKTARTGLLDFFFQSYLQTARPGQTLIDWVNTDYDPQALEREFKPIPWISWVVDTVLRRE